GRMPAPASLVASIALIFGLVAAVVGLRRWTLRRAVLAERPRSPDEWLPADGRRLWQGQLQSSRPLAGGPLYRRVELDRWDAGRWRRITTQEESAAVFELVGERRRMSLAVSVRA